MTGCLIQLKGIGKKLRAVETAFYRSPDVLGFTACQLPDFSVDWSRKRFIPPPHTHTCISILDPPAEGVQGTA